MFCEADACLFTKKEVARALSTWEAGVGELLSILGHPSLYSELQASLGHRVKPCSKPKQEK